MLKLLCFMNSSGCLFFLLNMLLYFIMQKFMPPKNRIFLCRLNLIFFVIPLPICLFYVRRYFDNFVSLMPIEPFVYTGTHIVIHLQQFISFALPKTAFYEILLLFTWIIVVIRICQKCSAKSRKIRDFNSFYGTFLEKQMEPFTVNASKLVDAAMKELGLKKKPRIQMEPIVKSPHIGGIFRCTLHLPCQWDVPEQVYYIAIKHELAHLKNKDLLFQRISLIVRIIHWFNPVVYLLIKKMNQYQELAADAMACEGESRENRRAFQLALVDLSAEESNVPDMLALGLGNKRKGKFKNFTEERILTIDNKKLYNHKFIKLAATAVISVVMFTLALIPALAYNLPATIEIDHENTDTIDTLEINVLPPTSSLSLNFEEIDLYSLFENIDFSENSFVCIDETGAISYYNSIDSRIIPCPHNYLAARTSHHDKNSDGSCTITYYDAKKCSKCGHLVTKEEIGHTIYNVCPH